MTFDTNDIAAGIGGMIMSVMASISTGGIVAVIVYAAVGGFVGVIAKKGGEASVTCLKKRFSKNKNNPK